MNTTIKLRIYMTCLDSLISLMMLSLMRSIVNVELEAMTSEESVDIEAESTNMTISAIIPSERPESIVGIIESKPLALMSI